MENLDSSELERLAKSSRRSAFLTAFGALIVLSAFVYSAYQLSELDERIAEKQAVIEDKAREIETAEQRLQELHNIEGSLDLQIKVLRNQKDSLLGEFRRLSEKSHAQIASLPPTPIETLVIPRADTVPIGHQTSDGRELREYSLWVEVPDNRISELAEVSYFFNHPTFREKVQRSSNAIDGFRVKYIGWGCLYRIVITLVLENGQRHEIDFNMCQALGVD